MKGYGRIQIWLRAYIGLSTRWAVRGYNPGESRDFQRPSRPDLEPTKPPVQRVPVPFAGVKRSGRGIDHPPPLALTLKKKYSYTSTPALGLHGLFFGKPQHHMEVVSFKPRSLYPWGKKSPVSTEVAGWAPEPAWTLKKTAQSLISNLHWTTFLRLYTALSSY
jgi:hypothetical protein